MSAYTVLAKSVHTRATQRVTDAPFSPAEARWIRRMIELSRAPWRCPRCSSELANLDASGCENGVNVAVLRCPVCRRMVTV